MYTNRFIRSIFRQYLQVKKQGRWATKQYQKIILTDKGLSKMRAFSRIFCKLDGKCAHFHENAQNQVFWLLHCSGGSRGVPLAHTPPRVQILLFWHTNFLKRSRLGSWHPPYEVGTPPQEILDPPLHCVYKLLLSRPYELILSLCTQLTPFKTIWPNFVIVDTIDSFQDHMTWCLYCVPKSLISKHMTPFKIIWPDFCIVYPVDSFQDHLT